jgi:hypothetical protein
VRLEGLGKLKKIHLIRDLNRRPSTLQHSASANYTTACPPSMIIKSTIFRNVAPCSLVEFYLRICEFLLDCTASCHRRYHFSSIKRNSTPVPSLEERESERRNGELVYRNVSLSILVSYDFNTQRQRMFEKAGAWRML